jgi:hypothetical protein
VNDEGVKALSESYHLRKVNTLDLSRTCVGFMGLHRLSTSEQSLPSLKEVKYEGIVLKDDFELFKLFALRFTLVTGDRKRENEKIAKLKNNLSEADFSGMQMSDEGLEALSRLEYSRNLETLNVSGTKVKGSGLRAIAVSHEMQSLKEIVLSNTKTNDEGIAALCSVKHGIKLEKLDLSASKISNKAIKAIASSDELVCLLDLSLAQTIIDDEGVAALSSSKSLKSLSKVNLSKTKVSNKALKGIASLSEKLPWIELSLVETNIDDEGVISLCEAKSLEKLQTIDLSRTQAKGKGLTALAMSERLSVLKTVKVFGNQLEDESFVLYLKEENCKFNLLYNCEDGKGEKSLQLSKKPNRIDFSSTNIGDKVLKVLGELKSSSELQILEIEKTKASSLGLTSLSNSKQLANLKEVRVSGEPLKDKQFASFLRMKERSFKLIINSEDGKGDKVLDKIGTVITNLNLSSTGLGDSVANFLSAQNELKNLNYLDFQRTALSSSGLSSLASSKNLLSLKNIRISHTLIDDKNFISFLQQEECKFKLAYQCGDGKGEKTFSPLNSTPMLIDLSGKNAGDKVVAFLMSKKHLSKLTTLDLSKTKLSNEGLISIAESSILQSLQQLLLSNTQIDDQGLKVLCESKQLAKLTVLDISQNSKITSANGYSLISSSKTLKNLVELRVSNSSFDNSAAAFISLSKHLTNLEKLDLSFHRTQVFKQFSNT